MERSKKKDEDSVVLMLKRMHLFTIVDLFTLFVHHNGFARQ
jgi:hypothetical protein